MALNKILTDITENDLADLVTNKQAERKTIEYKAILPGRSDDDRKEFFADVSSFANASGGWLIYGIAAKDGVPTSLAGIDVDNADATVLGLESAVRDGIKPRISVACVVVPLAGGKSCVVMHIPRSYAAPHMVTFKNWSRFFVRDSNGKHQLDIDELRTAFIRGESIAEHMRDFHRERIANVIADEMPLALEAGAKVVLHVVPFSAFDTRHTSPFDLSTVGAQSGIWDQLRPINMGITYHRYNFDGFLTVGERRGGITAGYVQLFRTGIIEAVDGYMLREDKRSGRTIPSVLFEQELVAALPRYLSVQRALTVEAPVAVILTLTGVKGYDMAGMQAMSDYYNLIDRDVLTMPEVVLDNLDVTPPDVPRLMKPLFDPIWQATGYKRSMNYDDAGNWQIAP